MSSIFSEKATLQYKLFNNKLTVTLRIIGTPFQIRASLHIFGQFFYRQANGMLSYVLCMLIRVKMQICCFI